MLLRGTSDQYAGVPHRLKALWIISFKRVFNLSCGRVVYRVEKSKVLMEDTWEKDLDFRLSKRSLETQFIKVKHATPRNKWSVCWSSLSITYLSPLEGHCFSRSSAYQWVWIVPLGGLFNFQLWRIYQWKKFCKSIIIDR
jgi:hypothetical protein